MKIRKVGEEGRRDGGDMRMTYDNGNVTSSRGTTHTRCPVQGGI